MKRILLLSFLLLQTIIYSQNNDYGGQPVLGVTPVKRLNDGSLEKMEKAPLAIAALKTAGTPTGNSTETGTTEGQLEVSLTGSATYTIPIAMPPGINGVTPRATLSYNSQGGNGIAGYGWDINGISTISRIPSTMFHDGVIDGVDFDNLDRFAFDGQRLILKSGTYGGNGAEYETENFSNVKITSHGVSIFGANYGPAYFLVQYPDGSVAYYGNSTDSRSFTQWSVTSWQNPQGVSINYSYISENNELTIEYITYGPGNNSNTIQFGYESRYRLESGYTGGQFSAQNKILKTIAVSGNNTGFRHYVLAHEVTSLGYERLTSITEKSGDNTKSYNPTVFSYGNTAESMAYLPPVVADLSVQNIRLSNAATVSGDFNGDGSMDFLLYPTIGPNAKRKYWLFDQLNDQYINLGWEHNVGVFEEIFPVSWLTWNEKLLPQQGWCVVKQNTATNVTSFQTYSTGITSPIYAQGLKEYVFPKHIVSYYDPNECYNCPLCPDPIEPRRVDTQDKNVTPDQVPGVQGFDVYMELDVPKRHISGDFNGDGLTDVAVINKSVSYNETYNCQNSYRTIYGGKTYFVNLDRRLTGNFVNEAGYLSVRDDSKILVADFNGDGKEDIYVLDNGYVKIYTLTEDKQFVNIHYSPYDTDIVTTRPILLGDYNGDGKMDFMIPKGYNNYVKYTATGTAFIKDGVFDLPYRGENSSNHTYHVIANDFNNDGKTDIAFVHTYKFYDNTGDGSITVQLYKNNGSAFILESSAGSGGQNDIIIYPIPIFLNSNQPNQSLELAFISDRKIHRFQSRKDFSKEKLLQSVTTGNGVTENITYASLTATGDYFDDVYTPRGGNEVYPNIDITTAPTFKVVSRIEKRSSTSTAQQLFKYAGAVTNVSGLGFLGFQNTMRTNWHNEDLPVLSTVSKYDITKRGAVTENYTVPGLSYPAIDPYLPFITKSTLAYEQELSPTKVFKIKNTAAVNVDGINNTATETATQYDAYNNPTVNTTLTKSGSTVEQTETVTVDYLNQPAGGTYYIGRPQRKQVTITSNGDTTTSEEVYTFNSNHLLSQVSKKGHLTDYITEDNIFDAYGNITRKTITATGLSPRVTNYEYDPSGRFLLKSIDIEGLQTQFVYNTSNGWLLSTTNPNNLTTQYGYDVWGKKIRTTDYLGKTVTTTYSRTASVQTLITTQSDEGSSSIQQLDDLGREIVSGIKNIDDTWSYTMTRYDAYGRKISVGEPVGSITASPTQLTTYRYDTYGRLTESVAHTGQTTTTAYSGLTTTINDGTKTVITVKDAIGNIKSLTDPSGTINYQYYAGGNLKQSNYEGNVVSMEYDGWGRKTRLIDSSAGTYTYTYNALGELIGETTPKGNTAYVIDHFGKAIEKTIVGTGGDTTNSKTIYIYHPTSKLLTNTRFDDFTNRSYTQYSYYYDNYNRLTISSESDPNANYQTVTEFDAFGRPGKQQYTANTNLIDLQSSKWVRNTYKNGYHWQILDDATGQVLWQSNTVNERGQLTSASYGNGITITNTYDQYGFPAQSRHDKTAAVNVMTLNTTFEPLRGNLTSRYNSLFNKSETFQYDNLDRLTSFTNAKGQQEQQAYNNNGTIETNSTGDYRYSNTQKPHQNTSVNLSQEAKAYYQLREGVFFDTMEAKKGWEVWGNGIFSFDDTFSHSGGVSLKINNTEAAEKYVHSEVWIPINNAVATEYTYSAWVYSNAPETQLFLFMKDENETWYYTYADNIKNNTVNQWTYVTKTVLVPASIKRLNLRLDNNDQGIVWFDDVKIRRTENPVVSDAQRSLDITYNAFKSPIEIIEPGCDRISFDYNTANTRSTMYYGGLQEDRMLRPLRKYYSTDGSIEIKYNTQTGETEFIIYIGGDGYSAPVVLKSNGTTEEYLYLHRDYQGSILAITNQAGNIVEKRLFDAWGAVVKIQDGAGNTLSGFVVLDRGYTGHEHLQGVNLIHMNGRLYDPVLHRFLQPDNYVQDPYNPQNYNRYGYCLNNPLKYTDASGEWIWIAVAAVVGGVVNWVAHGARFDMEGLKAFGIGAAAGTIGALTGGFAFAAAGGAAGGVGGFAAGAFGAGIGSATSQAFLSVGNHVAFGDPLMSVKEFITGVAFATILGGSFNGITALSNGRSFWNGTTPRIAVQPITLPSAGIKPSQAPEIKSNSTLPSTTQTSTAPTTQSNTASKVTFTKNIDGNGYKVDGLGVVDDAAKTSTSSVQANRTAGNLFRDELAEALRAEGRTVNTEVFKRTPFGARYMDLDVWHNGVNLGGIETKVGGSRYLSLQRLKDAWLGAKGYPVQLVRKPVNW